MSNLYLERYGWPDSYTSTNPSNDLELVVVIPIYNETDVVKTLESLASCSTTPFSIEVFLVINQSEVDIEETKAVNHHTEKQISKWISTQSKSKIDYHLINVTLKPRHAGVGSARKIGMDEAVRRFELLNKPNAVIVNLDADCVVDDNYFNEIFLHFSQNPDTPGASIYFEHPLKGELDRNIYEGISNYELFLRYYRQGLLYSGFPYHYHTVGSSMAVRSIIYQKQGGMNRRKAGEDFYFLHKIMPIGRFTEINTTCVHPSPRSSNRVPFGTGKAINDWLVQEDKEYTTYHPSVFNELQNIFRIIPELYKEKQVDYSKLNTPLRSFLQTNDFNLDRILKDSGSYSSFIQKFFEWFNGFRVLKFIHYCRDHYFPEIALISAAKILLETMGHQVNEPSINELLEIYRKMDRGRTK